MELIEQIKEDLKQSLSEKRYVHSLGVMDMCEHLAKIHHVNVEKAKLAGLLHDIAKEMTDEEIFEYANKNNIELTEVEKINTKILHGKIGAHLATEKYGIDEEVADAIKYHTTTSRNMDTIAKIVYVSDKVELGRKSDKYDVEYERYVAEKDLNTAMLIIIDATINRLISKGSLINLESIDTRNAILIGNF